jgi:hypothetical protein
MVHGQGQSCRLSQCFVWGLSQANADVPSLFKHLSTQWDLREVEPAKTEVALQLRFQFSNPFYAAASGAVFEKVARKVMEGFEKRCKSLYGWSVHSAEACGLWECQATHSFLVRFAPFSQFASSLPA